MQWQRITAADDKHLGFIQWLYETSFPLEERRAFADVTLLLTDTRMHLLVVANESGVPVGFVIYWQFDAFLFIEHLAIDATFRSQGFGGKMMQHVILQTPFCCLLEVEHPHDVSSEKRIRFYEQLGFQQQEIVYFQPAYHDGGQPVPMLLLSNGRLSSTELTRYIREVRQVVYSITEQL